MARAPASPAAWGAGAEPPRKRGVSVRRRAVVRGRVQGVWFRASAEREAARLGVSGFARNERDGSVTVEAEGRPEAVDAMVGWCRTGPARAEVTEVVVTDLEPLGTTGFRAT